ncbi:MAG: D-alanyl-D-alanine carboxypeptidase [Chloroflexi bacterium]|nr:D-alanyl-D-alanine carboxypeptidase [Chloroflexota bacterium]MBV9595735.1 D-alanyl-D-alanine carboxypeptidase [Chloroflexota bacterium]
MQSARAPRGLPWAGTLGVLDMFFSRRFGIHGLAIAIVGGALIGASFSRPAVAVQPTEPELAVAAAAVSPSLSEVTTPTAVSLEVASLPPPTPTVTSLAQTTDQVQATVTFDPRLGLPQWLRAIHDLPLWSSGDSSASSNGSLPAGSAYVKPLGPFGDSRIEVYFPGDGEHPATQAWVDTANVQASGVPPWIAPPAATTAQPGEPASLPVAPQRTGDDPPPNTTAVHIAIIDDASGQMIYGEQPNTQVPQASTTKIATTIVALERDPDLSQRIKVTVSASQMVAHDGSSTMGIEPGLSVSLDTLLHGMMLPSGNDAAEQVAVSLGGSREQYVEWMNEEVAALGLKDTHFVNPSGMDAEGHYSSAYDMAMLARYAMRNSTFRDLAADMTYAGDGFKMANLNRLLGVYPGADGVKIGFTDAAQKTFVASAVHDGHRVFVSLMRSEDLPGDSTALFNWVWNNFNW